jgi:AraC family transcriptional activator of pobA
MYKSVHTPLRSYQLDRSLYHIHKNGMEASSFGMDNSPELLAGGFGLYSTTDMKKEIGPAKTDYYRIGFFRRGSAKVSIGLENFHPGRNDIVFGFPGQVFSLKDPEDDFFGYYLLFNENFLLGSPELKLLVTRSAFYSYQGIQCFRLQEKYASFIDDCIQKMNADIQAGCVDTVAAIRLWLQLLLIQANRAYGNPDLSLMPAYDAPAQLYRRFLKLVSQHFLSLHKVSDYASLLHVSPDHLTRIIRSHSGTTARQHIHEMLLIESKALLLHSPLTVAEISYQLKFSDPSHFNKFFRKHTACTPLGFRCAARQAE